VRRRLLLLALIACGALCATAAAGAVPVRSASSALARDASHGLDRGIFTASPGGVFATAARVARWRPLVRRAVRGTGVAPDLLEGMVLVESSGRPDAVARRDVAGPAGLTQLTAFTARSLLHVHVDLRMSRRLTRRLLHVASPVRIRQLRRVRAQYDARFSPATSLRATARYLAIAGRRLGRADLAVEAYHIGLSTVERAVTAYGGEEPSYAELYFGSAPDRHADTWRLLAAGGDYYWKVLAAERVMRIYRHAPRALALEERGQARKNSAEEVLHPESRTATFATPAAIALAWTHHVLRAIPHDVGRTHLAISRFLGQQAHKLGRSRRLYAGLRPAALDVLLYIGQRVHELSGARRLLVTSAVRDRRYQRVLTRVNANATRNYSMHTTGYAFDIARTYSSGRQAAAFQFVLDRLVAVNAIAYIRESAAIHIAVASDARAKLALLNVR
jgi:Family of unknown function (DUF5715)